MTKLTKEKIEEEFYNRFCIDVGGNSKYKALYRVVPDDITTFLHQTITQVLKEVVEYENYGVVTVEKDDFVKGWQSRDKEIKAKIKEMGYEI